MSVLVEKSGLKLETIKSIQNVLRSNPEIKHAVLYGSRAMGTYRIGSDIDLCLKGKDLNTSLILKIENQLDDLLLPYTFDICIYDKIDNQNLIDHIDRVGISFI